MPESAAVQLARFDERLKAMERSIADANGSSVKDRAELWRAVNEMRRNGGWRGKAVGFSIPTGAGAGIAILIQHLIK